MHEPVALRSRSASSVSKSREGFRTANHASIWASWAIASFGPATGHILAIGPTRARSSSRTSGTGLPITTRPPRATSSTRQHQITNRTARLPDRTRIPRTATTPSGWSPKWADTLNRQAPTAPTTKVGTSRQWNETIVNTNGNRRTAASGVGAGVATFRSSPRRARKTTPRRPRPATLVFVSRLSAPSDREQAAGWDRSCW